MACLPWRAVIADFDRTLLRTDKTISGMTRKKAPSPRFLFEFTILFSEVCL